MLKSHASRSITRSLPRGRGMAAAAGLALAVGGTYAVLMLASAGIDGGSAVLRLGGAVEAAGHVLFRPPTVRQTVQVAPGASGVARPTGAALRIDLGRLRSTSSIADAVHLTNTSDVARRMQLQVSGAPGVTATFAGSGAAQTTVAPRATAAIAITTRADHAGPISGQIVVRVKGSSGTPVTLPLAGAQAPLPVPQLSVQPRKGGAVAVSWSPSPSTGVAGYAVYRASGPGKPAARIADTTATHLLDRPAADGPAVYEVRPLTAGVSPELLGPASSPATAVADRSAPEAPLSWSAPQTVNAAQVAGLPVSVTLPPSSSPDDQVTVGLTDGTSSVTAAAHGGGPVSVSLDASALADGPLHPFVTLTDPLGNSATYTSAATVLKDTVAPAAPSAVAIANTAAPAATINAATESAVQVRVDAAPQPGDQVVAELDADGAAPVRAQAPAGEGPLVLDASSLPDGPLTLSAWVVDAAGNPSARVQVAVAKDTQAPRSPLAITTAPTETAPAGSVNADSQAEAVVLLAFDGPTNSGNRIQAQVGGLPVTASGGAAQVALGPLDLSALPDGPIAVGGTITDQAGNVTSFSGSVLKDTVAPQAPTSAVGQGDGDTPPGTVDADDRSCVDVHVAFASPSDPGDTIVARLVQGDVEVDASAAGGGSDVWLRCLDLSAAAPGTVELTGVVRDAAGNSTPWTGSPLLLLPGPGEHAGGSGDGDGGDAGQAG